ncbi:hypothetical protein [Cryobacterium sp. TMS1-13-1]|uniref:hypothetical protein n=1 Tax=Cryobacterium sp. TMS1-13-1 TaxID=1259220 RepID=UPI00106BB766|nr:hypothetical protein [Cryobacterium sp. TMS1-13-1]TFD21526.1 hypothetical protein E3T31_12105 [Cryobacterium sp. TMS1-13-1]
MAGRATRRVHVLVLEVPGWGEIRMRVEAELARRGWTPAISPADADVLLVCGEPGQELECVCARLWSQLPGPRVRTAVITASDVASTLDRAVDELLDDARQHSDARARSRQPTEPHDEIAHTEHAAHDGSGESTEHDMDMDMDMDMPTPGGIPLATSAPDRDGLEMDVLHVPLGPVLPHWPAGLVVRCVLQGDVIVSAQAEILPAAHPSADGRVPDERRRLADDERRRAVIRRSDAAASVLALAGWSLAAGRARRIRDAVASGTAPLDAAPDLDKLAQSISRSWTLRWTLKGITVGDTLTHAEGEMGQSGSETVRGRLIGWLDEARRIARDDNADGANEPQDLLTLQRSRLSEIPRLLNGTDVATARLIIAALAIETAPSPRLHSRAHE